MLTRISTAAAAALLACTAWAHDGHGQGASHWHATDIVGLLLVGGLATLAVWFTRGGK